MTTALFSNLPLPQSMLENLESLGYKEMTPIQEKSLPVVLAGKDLIAKARTGSGKTAAFALGLLDKLNVKSFAPQSLVICPTRELSTQVAKEIRRLARFKHNIKVLVLCGGQSIGPQVGSLEHGAHIIVGTPGRLLDHLRKRTLSLRRINTLVLDEADRMLDMGFYEDIENIIAQIPKKRQTMLFSATYPEEIKNLSSDFQIDPVEVSVESVHSNDQIKQIFYQSENKDKKKSLLRLLEHHRPASGVIFCNTKQLCSDVSHYLYEKGHSALALHGDMEQKDRDQVMARFANGSNSFLVATDVAARGLDIKDLQAVINFDVSNDPEVYIHRIGRTGRAGKKGLALSLFTSKENYKLEMISEYQGSRPEESEIENLEEDPAYSTQAEMRTLCISAGKKQKIRPGDILGALTGEAGIEFDQIGKIDLFNYYSYVAIKKETVNKAVKRLNEGNIKGKKFKVKRI